MRKFAHVHQAQHFRLLLPRLYSLFLSYEKSCNDEIPIVQFSSHNEAIQLIIDSRNELFLRVLLRVYSCNVHALSGDRCAILTVEYLLQIPADIRL